MSNLLINIPSKFKCLETSLTSRNTVIDKPCMTCNFHSKNLVKKTIGEWRPGSKIPA